MRHLLVFGTLLFGAVIDASANGVCALQLDGFGVVGSSSAVESVSASTMVFKQLTPPVTSTIKVLSTKTSASVAGLFNQHGTLQITRQGVSLSLGGVAVATATFPGGVKAGDPGPRVALTLTDAGQRNYRIASTSGATCNLPWDTVGVTTVSTARMPTRVSCSLGIRSTNPTRSSFVYMNGASVNTAADVTGLTNVKWAWTPTANAFPMRGSLVENGATKLTWKIDSEGNVTGQPRSLVANGVTWQVDTLVCSTDYY